MNYTTSQPQLHYITTTATTVTALHHTTSRSCGKVTTATIATIPKTQFQPPVGPPVDSLCHPWFTTTNLSYRFPIFDTSATALCGTTGMLKGDRNNITTLFVGCKHGRRSKNASNNFDPFVFFPDGESYMYVRPLLRQKPCPGRFTFREGVESP